MPGATLKAAEPDFTAITQADLDRARDDPMFRQELLTASLNRLIEALNRCRSAVPAPDPQTGAQLREGAELAVRLADIIARHQAKHG